MKIGFITDPLDSLKIKKDSTYAMMCEAARRDHELYVMQQDDLAWKRHRVVGDLVGAVIGHVGDRNIAPAGRGDVDIVVAHPAAHDDLAALKLGDSLAVEMEAVAGDDHPVGPPPRFERHRRGIGEAQDFEPGSRLRQERAQRLALEIGLAGKRQIGDQHAHCQLKAGARRSSASERRCGLVAKQRRSQPSPSGPKATPGASPIFV